MPGPYTFWLDSFTPTSPSGGSGGYNLGMGFTTSAAARVTAIQFWKAVANTGTHIGSVWDGAGGLLGQVTFTGESASGWQTATFATPIAIVPGVTYTAAVTCPASYVYVSPFSGLTDDPLTQNAGSTYVAGATVAFPTTAFPGTFFIDIIAEDAVALPGDMRASQALAETWVQGASAVQASQALAEIWLRHIPVTAVVVSQALAEVWVPSPITAPTLRRAQVSAQVV